MAVGTGTAGMSLQAFCTLISLVKSAVITGFIVIIYNNHLSHGVGSVTTGVDSPPFTGKGEFVHAGAVGCKLAVLNSYILITIISSGNGGYSRDVLRTADVRVRYAAYQDRDGVILNMNGLSHLVTVTTVHR